MVSIAHFRAFFYLSSDASARHKRRKSYSVDQTSNFELSLAPLSLPIKFAMVIRRSDISAILIDKSPRHPFPEKTIRFL